MRLTSILTSILIELGVGTALFVCAQKTGEIRKSFFSFQSGMVAASFFLAWLFAWLIPSGQNNGFVPLLMAWSSGLAAARCFSGGRNRCGKIALWVAAASAGWFLVAPPIILTFETASPNLGWLAMEILNIAAGTFLFGWASGAMILGHWYLIMRGLSFEHLRRATQQLLIAVGARIALFAGTWLWFQHVGIAADLLYDPLLMGMRALWGLLLPGIFGFMAWRCARIGSNQAGTGLLYITVVAVLIGEILAGHIGF